MGHQVQMFFFAVFKQIFIQTLVNLIFKFFSRVLGPMTHGTPLQTKLFCFTYEVLGIKIVRKGCVEFISEGFF